MSDEEFLIVPMGDGQDAIEVIHEPCGTRVLVTMTVHLDTLVRIAPDHRCSTTTVNTTDQRVTGEN